MIALSPNVLEDETPESQGGECIECRATAARARRLAARIRCRCGAELIPPVRTDEALLQRLLRDDCEGRCCTRCGNARGVEYDGWGDGGTWRQGCLGEVREHHERMRALVGFAQGLVVAFVARDASEGWQRVSEPSPAWVWSDRATSASGRLVEGASITHARLVDHGKRWDVDVSASTGVELHTTLPAWSLAQCKRWVEQWVASQSDAAVAAFEAAEGMR